MARGMPRPGGEVVKIKNPLNPDRIRTGTVTEWTSYGSPMCVMDDNGEKRGFPADWVTVIQEAPPLEVDPNEVARRVETASQIAPDSGDADFDDLATRSLLSAHDRLMSEAERLPCPHTSNGQMCRYYADHEGGHTYGGGLGDPISNRHCGEPQLHVSHAWTNEKNWFNCSGRALDE